VNVRLITAAGLEILAVRSEQNPARRARLLLDVHVYYVCRKPVSG
jgi:hypothetical protein